VTVASIAHARRRFGAADPAEVPEPFAPAIARLRDAAPSPGRRRTLHTLVGLLVAVAAWACFGRLDIVVVADGKLVPRTQVQVVQPMESGVLREVLVDEGAFVVAGDVLARLDASLVQSETRALQSEMARAALRQRRVRAELAGVPLARHADDDEALYQSALAQHDANRRAHASARAHEAGAVERLAAELAAAEATARKLDQVVPIVASAASRFAALAAEGFVSAFAALERERERIEKEHERDAQRHVVAGLEAALAQARERERQVVADDRRALEAELAQAGAEHARAAEALARQLWRGALVELRAPASGTVKDVAARTPGAVLGQGAVFATIVPAGDGLVAEVLVRHEDAGVVRAGLPARVKFAAFPFTRYGTIDGRVVHVAPDASDPPASDAARGPGGYRARIELAQQAIDALATTFPVGAGMLASAEIRLGDRRVVEYLLSPMQRAWHEAARER